MIKLLKKRKAFRLAEDAMKSVLIADLLTVKSILHSGYSSDSLNELAIERMKQSYMNSTRKSELREEFRAKWLKAV